MMTTKISRSAQLICGGALLAIAVTTGATGLWINVHHGLEIRPEAGILFGLADLTKIVLPIVCGLTIWTLQTRIVAAVCILTSLFCAVTAFNLGADQHLAGKQHGAEQYDAAKATVARLEAEVASMDAQAAAEALRGGCGRQCQYLGGRADKARQELAAARTALASAKPVEVAGYERINARISSVLFLVLIEALVWLSVPAMSLLARPSSSKPKKTRKVNRSKAKAPSRTKTDWTKPEAYAVGPRLTKSGKVDGRTRQARAVKKIVATRVLA